MPTYKTVERNVVIDWGDVKQKFLGVVAEQKPWEGVNASHGTAVEFARGGQNPYGPPKCKHSCQVTQFKEGGRCQHQHPRRYFDEAERQYKYTEVCAYCVWCQQQVWNGGSFGQTLDWLRDGYSAPEFAHSAEYVPMAEKKRPTWNEEPDGDLDLGRLYGGYDDPYLVPADQDKMPGLRVMIEFAFACGVTTETIQQYGAWVAGLLGSLESSGYDLTVDLWIPLDKLFVGSKGRDNVLVRVKRENEVSNFHEWSALFSPTGYRHLGFCAKLVAGDKIKTKAVDHLGMTLGGYSWGLDYEKDESILKIHVDQRGSHYYGGDAFPKDKLTKQAQEIGLLPKPVEV